MEKTPALNAQLNAAQQRIDELEKAMRQLKPTTGPAPVIAFEVGDIVKHLKTGGCYIIAGTPARIFIEATREPAYAYARADGIDDRIWIRPQTEMEDGRFELLEKRQIPKFLTGD